ncbi:MAG TPA: Mur ligase family protein [Longimicrobiales bacterium]|nr:Mur ligase family protein [Longimicrobiales bacterium]
MAALADVSLLDSRRLTGPNLVSPGPAAVLDVACPAATTERLAAAWSTRVQDLVDALGRRAPRFNVRAWPGGVSLAFSAPIDALYASTELSEWALQAALADLAGESAEGRTEALEAARAALAEEANPALLALESAARERAVAFLWDDDEVSVGMGRGSLTWPTDAIPPPGEVDWTRVHDVPAVLVTGTNGKTTVVRLTAAMGAAAGRVVGSTTTEGILVGDEWIEKDDYSGPGGARTLLRDRRVEVAVLETARGGLLRRGVAFTGADGTVVTNVAEDHLGEYGVHDLEALVDAKLTAGLARRPGAPIALNADDAGLVAASERLAGPIIWFTTRADAALVRSHLRAGGDVVCVDDGVIRRSRSGRLVDVLPVDDIPIALGGAAVHNVANALAAVAGASALGLPHGAIAAALRDVRGRPQDNPGRGNFYDAGGARVLVDFVHNPHGFAMLGAMVRALAPSRLLLVLGHAGDRGDDAVRDLARAAWELRPDRVIVKELKTYLRGRPEGEIPALIVEELLAAGAAEDVIERADDEAAAARSALAWARPGDLVILPAHEDRPGVEAVLREAGARPA